MRGFILQNILWAECKIIEHLQTSNQVWKALRTCHEKHGTWHQIMLVKQLLEMRFTMGTPLNETVEKIDDLIMRVSNMGDLDWPTFKTYTLINALGGEFKYMQSQVHASSNEPGFSANTVIACILQENDLIKRRAEGGEGSSTLVSQTGRCEHDRSPLICTHCKRTGHMAEFCISRGGKFAGHTLEEAHVAQRAVLTKAQNNIGPSSANIATSEMKEVSRPSSPAPSNIPLTATSNTTSSVAPSTFMINGITYGPVTPVDSANVTLLLIQDPNFPFRSFYVEGKPPLHMSIDWNEFSHPVKAYSASQLHGQPNESPSILDSGASCHISPEWGDFVTLNPIAPHPITGFGGSCIYATGIGTIELHTKTGKRMTLNHALFVPNSTIRLILVFTLNNDGSNACYFDAKSCSIIDSNGTVIITGHAWMSHHLYILDCTQNSDQSITPKASANIANTMPSSALYAMRMPDLKTWHRRLGHCSNHKIINMARQGIVEGMPIDLSSVPATCDHCILGKQTRSHVPKIREGQRATKRLERVFVDLCRPMPCVSKYGHLYSMNVIDNFSSYVWSLPLKSKSDAVNVLRAWHHAVERQTREKLKIIVTDNGELVSNTTTAWCQLHGIDHQLTAPYTSAQNGRAECLHRTILGKARAMRLSCNAPAPFWDEFCATSAYLTNFTASSSLHGKTPYELWFGHMPSLSHLREIGCRAFALIQTHNPKIFQRSTPCILISYAPHAKAYRLWDTTTGRIFNSYHITFIEHLQSQPTDLLLGTTINLNPDAAPSWDSAPVLSLAPPTSSLSNIPNEDDDELIPDPILPSFPPLIPQISPSSQTNQRTSSIQRTSPVVSSTIQPQNTNNVSQQNNTIIPSQTNQSAPPTQTTSPVVSSTIQPQNPNNVIQHNNNTVIPQNNNTVPPQDHNVIPTITITPPENNNTTNNNNNTVTPAMPPPLHRSSRLQACEHTNAEGLHSAFLSEFAPLHDSHTLLPLDFTPSDFPSVNVFLSSISDGSAKPNFDSGDDPSWSEAMRSPEREYWIGGARDKLRSLAHMHVFVLVPRSDIPRGRRPLKGKLVCKRKQDDAGNIVHYKVRYVARGYAQQYGVYYDKTTAPTARLESFRAILHIAATKGWDIQQIDVKTTFLHGILPEDETAYLEQPKGFEEPGKEDWVMRLMKSIYGLKQAGRIWNQTFNKAVTDWGFQRMESDLCIY